MCGYVSFSHKSTEITRRRRHIRDCAWSALRQFTDGAINRCHAYSTMTRAAGIWKAVLLFNPKFMICIRSGAFNQWKLASVSVIWSERRALGLLIFAAHCRYLHDDDDDYYY